MGNSITLIAIAGICLCLAAGYLLYKAADLALPDEDSGDRFVLDDDSKCSCGARAEYLWYDGAHLCDACDEKRMENN